MSRLQLVLSVVGALVAVLALSLRLPTRAETEPVDLQARDAALLAPAFEDQDRPKSLMDRPLRPQPPADPPLSYNEVREQLDADRRALGRRWMSDDDRDSVLDEARELLRATIREDLIPPWYGTTWAFYGTSQTPGQGTIACGYFVSTVLKHAGVRVHRVQLAQQASEHIVRTFADPAEVDYTSGRTPLEIVREVKARGAGLYVIGLDYHVGLLSWDGDGRVELCHSSVLPPSTVVCEDAARADAMVSHVHVLGPLLTDRVVEAWIEGKGVPTALP